MTTTRPTHCTNCNLKLTKNNTADAHGDMGVHDVCHFCWTSFGVENDHYDYGDHDANTKGCPACGTYVAPTAKPAKPIKDRTQAPQVHTSHAKCGHACTPAARAKCRKARTA